MQVNAGDTLLKQNFHYRICKMIITEVGNKPNRFALWSSNNKCN